MLGLEPFVIASFSSTADTVAPYLTILVTVALAVWGYSRYIEHQIFRPPIEFSIEMEAMAITAGKRLVRVTLKVHNLGQRECDVYLFWRMSGLIWDVAALDPITGRVRFVEPIYPVSEEEAKKSDAPNVERTRIATPSGPRKRETTNETRPDTPPGGTLPDYPFKPKQESQWETKLARREPTFAAWLPYTTFVGAGVTQEYTRVAEVDLKYVAAQVVACVNYARFRSPLARAMIPVVRWTSSASKREVQQFTFNHSAVSVIEFDPPSIG